MKPIKLSIKGLQSFQEEQTIDFLKLTEHGLFGIFGATGSGKSTILDAITLAIYGDIVRVRGSRDDKLEHLVNINCNELKVEFIFKLQEDFYILMRNMKMKKNERIFSSKKQILMKNDIILADKDTQIKKEIDDIIGLSMDDFTRSVVLPQGKFNEFLKLSGIERRDMLERIFGLQKYGKNLMEKIKINYQNHKNKVFAINNQIMGKSFYKENELEELEGILINFLEDKSKLNEQLVFLKEDYKFKEFIFNLKKELDLNMEKFEKLKSEEEQILKLEKKIELSKISQLIYEDYKELLNSEKNLKIKEGIFNNLEIEISNLKNNINNEKNSLENIKNEINELENKKELKLVTKELREKYNEIIFLKNQYVETTSNIEKNNKNIVEISKKLKNENEKFAKIDFEIEKNQSLLLNLKEVREIDILNKEFQLEKLDLKKVIEIEENLINLNKNLKIKIQEKINLEEDIFKIQKELSVFLEKQKLNYAYNLAINLEEGMPCPCCGAKSHPSPATNIFEKSEDLSDSIKKLNENLSIKISNLNNLFIENIKESIKDKENELSGRNSKNLKEIEKNLLEEIQNLKYSLKKYREEKKILESIIEKILVEKSTIKENISILNANLIFLKDENLKLLDIFNQLNKKFLNLNYLENENVNLEKIDFFIQDIMAREELLENINKKLKVLNLSREKNLNIIETLNFNISEKISQKNIVFGELNQIKVFFEEIKAKLKNSMNINNFTYIKDVESNLLDIKNINSFLNTIENYKQSVIEVQIKIKDLENKIGKNIVFFQELKDIEISIKEKSEILENTINSIGEVSSTIKKIKETISEVEYLIKEKNKEVIELEKFEELSKLFSGNTFVEYLALGKLKNIAFVASERLAKISNGHYALTTNETGDFLIIDNFNNGEVRRTATLSGGESFLVSLSLALALSNQIQLKNKTSLEFFFLDEGFGTLDSNLLDKVITSLENLKDNEKMSIGLITHVEELKDRVPRKLLLNSPIIGIAGTTISLR